MTSILRVLVPTLAAFCLTACFHCPARLVATPAPPLPAPLPPDPGRLKVLTWNIWMMPALTFQSPKNHKRAAIVAEEILKQDFDILCFEKAFDAGAREVLWRLLRSRYPH